MKSAIEVVEEIGLAVRPPRGISIVLREYPDDTPNWIAATGDKDLAGTDAFMKKVPELRKSNPIIDWSSATERTGDWRRTVKWLSKVSGT